MTLPLARNKHMLLVCACAPILAAEKGKKDEFYEDLDNVLRSANSRDKLILRGDFNARVRKWADL